jgi:hypothetical protein
VQKAQPNTKLLFIDIEWEPATAYVWRMWDENISPDQLIDEGGMLCFCARWADSKDYMFFSKWTDGRQGMAEAALKLLSEADAVVTYNGDKYDLPKITGEIILAGLQPPPPVTSIDCLKAVKKFGFVMNRLAYIGPLFKAGKKVKHEGFNLWKDVIAGDPKAQKRMEKYCIQDVVVLYNLYYRILPFIRNHPHMGPNKVGCGACGSKNVHNRGFRRTKAFRIQRLQCQDCGAWSDGPRQKMETK